MWINEPNTPLDEYRGGFQTRSVMTGVEVPVEIAQASFVCVVKDDTVMKKVVVKHTNFKYQFPMENGKMDFYIGLALYFFKVD